MNSPYKLFGNIVLVYNANSAGRVNACFHSRTTTQSEKKKEKKCAEMMSLVSSLFFKCI